MVYVLIFILSGNMAGSAEFNSKSACEQVNKDIRTAGRHVWAKCYPKGVINGE